MSIDNQKIAVVTGASSGIGAAFARQLAARKVNLLLVARRKHRLESLAAGLHSEFGVKAEIMAADLSNPHDVADLENRVSQLENLDMLINNAGFGLIGAFADVPIMDTLSLIQVQVLASVRLCRAALPVMLARHSGAIINVASIGAFIPKALDASYCAAKSFLVVFTESLAQELAGSGVLVQALCPGFTLTEFHDSPHYAPYHVRERLPRFLWMTSDQLAAASLKALPRGPVVFIPGLKNRLLVAIGRSALTKLLLKMLARRFNTPK